MIKPVLLIQNDAKEGAGQLHGLLQARGYEQVMVLGWEVDYAALQPEKFAGLVVLGGAQGVYETEDYPYLADEIRQIQDFVSAEVPVLGLCLGAQLLATALGGEVLQNESKELGWHDITLSDDAASDPLMAMHPAVAKAFHFHGDFFSLPPGCTSLASSAMTRCQLFQYNNAYGFQYHVEVDMALIEVMCMSNADYMADNGADAEAVIEKSREFIAEYMQRSAETLNAWIGLLDIDNLGVDAEKAVQKITQMSTVGTAGE